MSPLGSPLYSENPLQKGNRLSAPPASEGKQPHHPHQQISQHGWTGSHAPMNRLGCLLATHTVSTELTTPTPGSLLNDGQYPELVGEG